MYRGIKDFKKIYQPTTNIRKDEKRDLIADSYSILLGGRFISPSYFMYMGFMILGT